MDDAFTLSIDTMPRRDLGNQCSLTGPAATGISSTPVGSGRLEGEMADFRNRMGREPRPFRGPFCSHLTPDLRHGPEPHQAPPAPKGGQGRRSEPWAAFPWAHRLAAIGGFRCDALLSIVKHSLRSTMPGTLPTLLGMGPQRLVTLDLAAGETYALLLNALSEYAVVLEGQSAEQSAGGSPAYARALSQTAEECRTLVGHIVAAMEC